MQALGLDNGTPAKETFRRMYLKGWNYKDEQEGYMYS